MKFKIITILCASLIGCVGTNPGDIPAAVYKDGYHYGLLNKSLIENHNAYTWFPKHYNTYNPNLNGFDLLNFENTSIKIFMGTWCHDSKIEVPQFYKILDKLNFNYKNFQIIGLTKDKKGYFKDYTYFNITNTPTFILYRGDIEIGRIIEKPEGSLESHLLKILKS
jgi:thiol-disulfide isomerase/thioredoxin